MKILHLNSYYNGSIFYKNLFDKQEESGLDISVFVPVASKLNNKEDFGLYTTISCNHKKYDRFIFHLKHDKILRDIINKLDIDKYSLIHAHSLFSNGYVSMKIKEKFGIPYVVAVRNTDINTFFKKMLHLRKMGIKILNDADRIIFLSKAYRNELISKYIPVGLRRSILDRSLIIPNGIDDFWIENRLNKCTKPDINDLRLLYVGVVNKNKNITTSIKVIEMLRKKKINARLTIVGRIVDKSLFNLLRKSDYIDYIEPKPKEELLKIYRQNDIFLMPSIHESFGLVYAEAMSQGLPVIYTRGQGFDEQFDAGVVGFSVDCKNADEIVGKIQKIIENYSAISNRCYESVGKFSWDRISEEYIRMYKSLEENI